MAGKALPCSPCVPSQRRPMTVSAHVKPLTDAPEMYKTFRDKLDGCVKVVLKPN